MKLLVLSSIYFLSMAVSAAVPLTDNVVFAFEKCKSLSVDLEKGQLKEAVASSFDVHCQRSPDEKLEFNCAFFDTGSDKKISQEKFTGGSDLGTAELKDQSGRKIKFLIGKNFASYESGAELKACVGIFLFEKDALKKKSN